MWWQFQRFHRGKQMRWTWNKPLCKVVQVNNEFLMSFTDNHYKRELHMNLLRSWLGTHRDIWGLRDGYVTPSQRPYILLLYDWSYNYKRPDAIYLTWTERDIEPIFVCEWAFEQLYLNLSKDDLSDEDSKNEVVACVGSEGGKKTKDGSHKHAEKNGHCHQQCENLMVTNMLKRMVSVSNIMKYGWSPRYGNELNGQGAVSSPVL